MRRRELRLNVAQDLLPTSCLSCSRSRVVGGAGTGAGVGTGGAAGVLSFSIASSCCWIFSCIWRICSFMVSRSRRSCCAGASGVRVWLGVPWAKACVENRHTVPTMSLCDAAHAFLLCHILDTFPTCPGSRPAQGKVQLMALIYLLRTRQRGGMHGVASTGLQRYLSRKHPMERG